ncbi:MAG: Ig-like domain-containing protein [Pseudomonas sp.]
MSKDSGANHNDFITNDGSAGRLIQGSLSAALGAGDKVQVSVDGGNTWLDANMNGTDKWSFVDQSSHSANWEIKTRVLDAAGNHNDAAQAVTLDQAVEAPTAISWDGQAIHVEFASDGVKVGDTLHIMVDGIAIEHTLNASEVASGSIDHHWPSSINDAPADMRAALIDDVGNISDYRVSTKATVNTFTENFNGQATTAFVVGHTYTLNDFTVTAVHMNTGWNTGFGISNMAGTPSTSTALELGTAGAILRLDITNPEPVNTVSLTVGDLSTNEQLTAIFRDAAGNEVYREVLTSADGRLAKITCELPYGEEFKSVDLVLADGPSATTYIWIDDIKFGHYDYQAQSSVEPSAANQTITDAGAYLGGDEDNTFSIADVTLLNASTSGVTGNGGLDTLKLSGKDQVLDLTKLGEKISSVEVIDLTGTGNNTLNLSLSDVLEQGGTSLFTEDDNVQMMVKGHTGDKVNLDDLLVDGTDPGNWANSGQVTVGGVVYEVYRHDSLDAELLVQQGVQTNLV